MVDINELLARRLLQERPRGQDSAQIMALRLQQPTGPLPDAGSVWAHALTQGINGFRTAWGERNAERRADEREERNFDRLRGIQRQQQEEAAAFFGGGAAQPAPAAMPQMAPMPNAAPMAGGDDPRAMPGYDPMAGSRARLAAMPQGPQELPGGYRAPAGVDGVFEGLAPPTGTLANLSGMPAAPGAVPGSALPAPGTLSGLPPGVTMDMIARGLAHSNPAIRQQAQAMVQVAQLARRETPTPVTVAPGASLVDPRTGRPIFTAPERPQAPGEFDRLLAASGVAPNSPEAQQLARQILERRGQPPQTNVSVDNRAEGALVQADGRALNAIQESAGQARQLLQLFDRAEQAIRASPDGAGSQFAPILGQAARTLGFELPGTSEAEVLRSITNQLAALQRIPGSGATTNMEMQLYMQAVPRLGNTREGNLALLDMGRRLMRRRLEEATLFRQGVGQPDLYDRLNSLPPLFSEEERQMLAGTPQTAGDMFRGAVTGAQGIAGPMPGMTAEPPPSPQQELPVVSSPDQARGLPPGTRFRTPDGRVMEVPRR